jgi:Uma2 family endonuclease
MPLAQKYRPHYTYQDYCQWEGRWELIDGVPYAMSPLPVPRHQRVSLTLSMVFEKALIKCKKCMVYPPLDWKITEDTILQPDVLIVCNKIDKKYLDFPPILVVEVLSPSTASKDRGEKMELYQFNGVKYYLLADPKFNKLELYALNNGYYEPISVNPASYKFIFEKGCTADVNFAGIWE